MENEILVSVIIPVYKVEKYLDKAVASIVQQTLKNLEIYLVDDGSPDRCGEICDKWKEKDERIHVIHQENKGAAEARNAAIRLAAGKYMYFMDSDDWAEPEMLEDMVSRAEKDQSQLVVAGFFIDTYYTKEKYITLDYIPEDAVYRTKEEFRKNAYALYDRNFLYTPWNKLYLSKYIHENHLFFPNMHWDDFPFNITVVKEIERVSVMDKQYYHFLRARSDSESAKYNPNLYKKREEEHRWLIRLFKYWGVYDENGREMICRRYLERLLECCVNIMSPKNEQSLAIKRYRIRKIISKRMSEYAFQYAEFHGKLTKFLMIPIHKKWSLLVMVESCMIEISQRRFIYFFSKAKAGR